VTEEEGRRLTSLTAEALVEAIDGPTKVGTLESKDDLLRRIDEASKFVPLENLCLSPQCGFSSTHHGNALSIDDQWRKLERVVEVAGEVWPNG